MEITTKEDNLIVVLTKAEAQEIAGVLGFDYISPEKPSLKTFVKAVIHFSGK